MQDRLRLSRRFRSHDCASRRVFWGASRDHVGSQEENSVKLALATLRPRVTATLHSIWALRRLHLFKASAQETLPVFVDFPWRSGKRTGKDHPEVCQNIIAYPPSTKRRGVQDFWAAFREMCTARRGILTIYYCACHYTVLFTFILQSKLFQIDLFRPGRYVCLHASEVGMQPRSCLGWGTGLLPENDFGQR